MMDGIAPANTPKAIQARNGVSIFLVLTPRSICVSANCRRCGRQDWQHHLHAREYTRWFPNAVKDDDLAEEAA
jgi:hypothetical protein